MDNDWVSPFNGKEGPDFTPQHSHPRQTRAGDILFFTSLGFIVVGLVYDRIKDKDLLASHKSLIANHNRLATSHNLAINDIQNIYDWANEHKEDPFAHRGF